MKKFSLITLVCILTFNSYCQKKQRFKSGVRLTENNMLDEFKDADSILFIFDVVGCKANFYNDLRKQIAKRFKKSNKKIGFNFNIYTIVQVEKIPTKIHLQKDYALVCQIVIRNFRSWDTHLYKKRKQNYDLSLKISNPHGDIVHRTATINVSSYWNIATQNRKTSTLIYKLFND